MTTTPASVISEAQLQQMAAEIHQEIPGAEVRLFGSHARGEARPESDIDLLITADDGWLAQHSRFDTLGRLWRKLSHHRIPVDLLLYSQSQPAAPAPRFQPSGGSRHLLHEPRSPAGACVRAKRVDAHDPRLQLVSATAPRGPSMTPTPQANPSDHGRQLLEALGQSVAKALDTKRRLGHYAVTWQNGKPLLVGDDTPPAQAAPPGP